jgi:hypothetical protein
MFKGITPDELKEYLRKHKLWVYGEDGGERADLSYADLSYANLRSADLKNADLKNANLRNADLSYADLRGANLRGADLRSADLRNVDLSCADLRNADLRDVDLRGVKYNELTAFYALACPESGAFIGWKKARGKIVKLEICEDAKRSSATSRKCRCSKAKVLAIENVDGGDSGLSAISSDRNSSFVYTVGETVEVSDYDDNRWNECSTGIHFFITRDEAVRWGQ